MSSFCLDTGGWPELEYFIRQCIPTANPGCGVTADSKDPSRLQSPFFSAKSPVFFLVCVIPSLVKSHVLVAG